jgi:hypothetical protein
MEETSLLTLDTIAKYLREKEVKLEVVDQDAANGTTVRLIRMGWHFDMGDATVLISVNDGGNETTRMEITCVTQKSYQSRREMVIGLLNMRNRERAFSRSLDPDGNFWLEYVGFYPTLMELPQATFDTLFGGVLVHFQDDYAALEGYTPQQNAQGENGDGSGNLQIRPPQA